MDVNGSFSAALVSSPSGPRGRPAWSNTHLVSVHVLHYSPCQNTPSLPPSLPPIARLDEIMTNISQHKNMLYRYVPVTIATGEDSAGLGNFQCIRPPSLPPSLLPSPLPPSPLPPSFHSLPPPFPSSLPPFLNAELVLMPHLWT